MSEQTLYLSAQGIKKTFKDPRKIDILKDISLTLHKEETVSIIGSSGSGKSTLLHILGTLEKPTGGELYYFGKKLSLHNISDLRNQHIGFVFQMSHLLEEYSLLDNVLLKAKIARRDTKRGSLAYKEAMNFIDRTDLIDRLDFPVKLLSGGEKQRVAIARALMNDPKILFADEPTGNLDDKTRRSVIDLLFFSCKELKKSLIVVTHDQKFAQETDHMYHLNNGVLSVRA